MIPSGEPPIVTELALHLASEFVIDFDERKTAWVELLENTEVEPVSEVKSE